MKSINGLVSDFSHNVFPDVHRKFAREFVTSYKDLPLAHLISCGNKKLPDTMAIFNMSPATGCPSEKLGLCQAVHHGKVVCYALKAERLYPTVLPYRCRQEKYWKSCSAEMFAAEFVLIKALRNNPLTVVRLNEAGDFWGQSCIEKADRIAEILGHYGVPVYSYTARKDLDFSKVKFLVVNGSGFTKPGIPNEFKFVLSRDDRPKSYAVCPGNCRVCSRCMQKGKKTVIVKH